MSSIPVCSALQHRGGGHAGIHFIYFRVALCMATTSVCSLLQHWDANHDANHNFMSELLPKTVIIIYAVYMPAACIPSVLLYTCIPYLFNIVHMTAACLLPESATYRNAQLMDSLL